ncbi:hypothetical protein Dred_0746 [Desulforamulus reducens MI-1]|uniref:Uncharacterized protein n=1 Tax=Desulforamulus reducens (strain ATCC BAA-1160 / DSM 100696 / MI-1) TaxID=349161 RepID=A4J2I2_DESRM|nr:hypothetical protein [Desulforamulus reducens]ABO49285.1 hypothetical protein Dred_0746 [Desulforamulus reducens MI-1]
MEFAETFLNLVIIYFIVTSIFNLFALAQAKKRAQQSQANAIALKPRVEEYIEFVTDNICGCTLPKSKAYILAKDNEKHYFCSWDCREKFIAR